MKERLSEVILNATLTMVVLLFAAVLIRREIAPAPTRQAIDLGPPRFVMGWRDLIPARLAIEKNRPVHLVEFVDYECGFCKLYEETIAEVLRENPGYFSVSYVHFPIPGHRFARLAASAAECANQAGRFSSMHQHLFEKQDSLGLKGWTDLAHEIGVADTTAFRECLKADQTAQTIESDFQLAKAIGVNATPTLLVNGWKMPAAPTSDELLAIAKVVSTGGVWAPIGGDTVHPELLTGQKNTHSRR